MEDRRRLGRRSSDLADVAPTAARERSSQLYDADTGLASSTLFRDRTEHALNRAARNDGRVALLLLEMAAPERVADLKRDRRTVAQEMVRHVRPQDTVAWLDDSYVGVLVEDVEGLSGAQAMRRRLEEAVDHCRGSSVAVSDSRGHIGFWLGTGAQPAS